MKDLAKIRNDVVGSLLRPERRKRAHQDYDDGKIEIGTLREIEDQEIRQAVRLQEQLGLAVVADGEFRRLNFQDSFGESVSGYDAARASVRVYEHRVKGSNPLQRWENPSSSESNGAAVSLRHPAVERLRLTKNTPISPQCGFSSDVVGNLISEDDQKQKLELVVETGRQVWG